MKKLILALSLMVVAVAAFGQGRVNFANNNTDRRIFLDANNDGSTNGESGWVAGPNSQVAIYGLAGSGQPESSLQLQTSAMTNLLAPGFFLGGVRTLTIPGGASSLQVRAWSGSFPSYEAAQAAALGGTPSVVIGRSVVMNVTLTESPNPPAVLLNSGLNQFNVAPVPEPSSIALGLLGLGAIVLFRRRK